MAESSAIPIKPVPETLSHLIQLNVEYGVVICIGHGCHCAVKPTAISGHLQRKHKTELELRDQIDRYIERCPFEYDYSTVKLPKDRLAPQPIIKIVDGLQCKHCPGPGIPYRTQDHSNIKKHRNKVYSKKRIVDEDLFDQVRLQSWF